MTGHACSVTYCWACGTTGKCIQCCDLHDVVFAKHDRVFTYAPKMMPDLTKELEAVCKDEPKDVQKILLIKGTKVFAKDGLRTIGQLSEAPMRIPKELFDVVMTMIDAQISTGDEWLELKWGLPAEIHDKLLTMGRRIARIMNRRFE